MVPKSKMMRLLSSFSGSRSSRTNTNNNNDDRALAAPQPVPRPIFRSSRDTSPPFTSAMHRSITNSNDRSLTTFKEAFVKWLQALNDNPNIIYRNDFYKRFPDGDLRNTVSSMKTELKQHGITFDGNDAYHYDGDNPAAALDILMSRNLLFLDCRSALTLCQHLALRDTVGILRYNSLVAPTCRDYDFIGGVWLPIYESVFYPQRHHAPATHILQDTDVEAGDIVYFMGPENAFAFHPASEVNAFNVVAMGSGTYLGFHSAAQQAKTQAEYQRLMHEAYHKPLSSLDCYMILKATHYALLRSYHAFTKEELTELLGAGRLFSYSMQHVHLNSLQATETPISIPAPYDQAVDIGCVSRDTISRSKFDAFLSGGRYEAAEQLRYDFSKMSPPRFNHQLSFSRQSLGPHQNTVMAELNAFYEHCLNTRNKKQAGGLLLFGPAGTGKTAFCAEALAQLEREGFHVWKKLPEDSLMSKEQIVQALSFAIEKGKQAEMHYIIQQFQAVWENADILYVDDVNEPMHTDFHSLIARAAYEYAMVNRKQILITGNRNFLALQRDHAYLLHVRVAEILGADYRLEIMPWKNVTPAAQARSILNMPQTGQQNLMVSHLDALSTLQRTAGLYVMGPPGMGKSTVIEAFLRDKSVVRILRDGPVPNISDIKNNDYVLIEDIKDRMYLKSKFYDFIRAVIEHDWEGMNVKIIMTSNNLTLDQLLDDHCFKGGATGLQASEQRIASRAHALFKELHFGSANDFRASHTNTQIHARLIHQKDFTQEPDFASTLKMSAFNNTLQTYSSNEQWTAQAQYRKSQVSRILAGGSLTVLWDEKPNFGFVGNEFATMLMEMERGQLNLIVVLPDDLSVDAWKESLVEGGLGPEHISRLQRLTLQQNDRSTLRRVYQ